MIVFAIIIYGSEINRLNTTETKGPIKLQKNKHFSDATLTILSSLNNPLLRINFTNVFPYTVSDINFDTKLSADSIITCSASFRYQSYMYLPA